ncbi:hypothetical protein EII22_03020 [Coriobacteriales bacterium OH1046]|nr:hypothetical protein EII22_03020 [Coriobacteriales bacterium OH1046]
MSETHTSERRSYGASRSPRGMACRGVARPFLETTLASRARDGEVIALCADPGMGKTQLADAIGKRLLPDEVVWINLSGLDGEMAADRLARETRRLAPHLRRGRKLCVICDDASPADEYEVDRMARSLMRLRKLGATLIITLLPEAEQLLEGVDGCVRVGKAGLMVRATEISPRDRADEIMRASCGIPQLVGALQEQRADEDIPCGLFPSYGEALGEIARASLRGTLLEHERMLRFCALLLGSGTWDELGALVGGCPRGTVEGALKDAALAVLGYGDGAFSCVGLEDDAGLLFCSDALREAVERWPGCACAVVDRLMERDEIERAARIISWFEAPRRASLALRHGLALLVAGETALVGEALSESSFSEDASPYAHGMLVQAHDALWSTAFTERGDVFPARGFASSHDEADAELTSLIVLARKILGGTACCAGSLPIIRRDRIAAGLALHAEALRLLGGGCIAECYSMLMSHPREGGVYRLPEALLAIDREVARLLMCDESVTDDLPIRKSEAFFERMGFTVLAGWGAVLDAVRQVLAGKESGLDLGESVSRAERRGNTVLAAALGCVAAFEGLIRRAPVSAGVRAKRSGSLAAEAGCAALADIAALLQAVASFTLKDTYAYKPLMRRSWSGRPLEDIARLACAALSDEQHLPASAPVPEGLLWLVRALASLPGTFSRQFGALMYPAWSSRLSELSQDRGRPVEIARERSGEKPGKVDARHEDAGIALNVLGGFSLAVNGREIPERKLAGRSSKPVLAYLAALPQHRVARIRLIEALWPGNDLIGGKERIYQAASRIRRVVREIDGSLDPIVLPRNDGMIRLNPDEVHCDVDAFVGLAHSIIGREGSDEEVVEAAQRIDAIYKGDLYVPVQDVSGMMQARAREYRKLYTDVMVLGAESALRLGKRRLSTCFAEAAHLCDAGREDAVCALICALKASGRVDEAIRCYRAHARRIARAQKRPPSRELRAAIGTLLDTVQPRNDGIAYGIAREA